MIYHIIYSTTLIFSTKKNHFCVVWEYTGSNKETWGTKKCGSICKIPCPKGQMCKDVKGYCQADGTCGKMQNCGGTFHKYCLLFICKILLRTF